MLLIQEVRHSAHEKIVIGAEHDNLTYPNGYVCESYERKYHSTHHEPTDWQSITNACVKIEWNKNTNM